jgi:hypothetical protein
MSIAATVEAIAFIFALVAAFQMSSKRSGATHLDGCHDAPLHLGQRRAMIVAVSFPVAAEHVRHFPLRPIHKTPD